MDAKRYAELQPAIRRQLDAGFGERLSDSDADALADYLAAFIDDAEILVDGFNPSRRHTFASLLAIAFDVSVSPPGRGTDD